MSSVVRLVEDRDEMERSEQPRTQSRRLTGVNPEHLRMAEALLFAAGEPLDAKALATSLPEGADVPALLAELQAHL